jgi:hypothetical protein
VLLLCLRYNKYNFYEVGFHLEMVTFYFLGGKMKHSYKQFIVDETGKKKAIVLSLKEYEELLEDIHDLAVIAERRDEPIISFDELKKRLKADGHI